MRFPGFLNFEAKVALSVVAVATIFALIVACGQAAPAAAPAPAPVQTTTSTASQVTPEEMRAMIAEAVESSAPQTASPEEMRKVVDDAVAKSTANPSGVTSEELESVVASAVSEALAAQAKQSAMEANSAANPVEESGQIVLTDVAGRTVTVDMPVERVILGEGRQIYVVAALQPGNPFERIIGWRDDLRRADADTFNKYKELFPELEDIPEFGSPSSGEFSVEQAISLDADVVVLNLGSLERATEAGMIDQLEEVGIPVVVVDFRQEPLENTVPSMILLGRLFGEEERAQSIVDFYLQQVNLVYSRISQVEGEKPLVFLDRAAGIRGSDDCCRTFGRANLGLLIERAGGVNIGSDLIPGWAGTLNPEQIIVSNPDVIIATGSNWYAINADGGFVSMGYFTEPGDARLALMNLADGRPGWDGLDAVNQGRYHAVWHQFYNSPYHFVALQQFAKWFYPEEFADVHPIENLAEFHRKFLPIDYSGTFFVSASK